jgi:hypothetical protein
VCEPVENKNIILWSTPYSLRLHAFPKHPSSVVGYIMSLLDIDFEGDTIDLPDPGGFCYFIAETNYSTSRLIKCELFTKDGGPDADQVIAKLVLPLETCSSVDLLGSYWDIFNDPEFDDAVLDLMQVTVSAHSMQWFYNDVDGLFATISMKGDIVMHMNRIMGAKQVTDPGPHPPSPQKRRRVEDPDPARAAADLPPPPLPPPAASTTVTSTSGSSSGPAPAAASLELDPHDELILDLYVDDITGLS